MKKSVVTLIALLFGITAISQTEEKRFSLDFSNGTQTYSKAWSGDAMTSALVKKTSNSFAIQSRFNIYFTKHWGVNAIASIALNKKRTKNREEFFSLIKNEYQNQYYILNTDITTTPEASRILLSSGVQYRFRSNKWGFVPRLNIGFTTFTFYELGFDLKEKGSNTRYAIMYDYDARMYDNIEEFLFINPAFQTYYQFPGFHIFAEIGYIQFFKDVQYTMTKYDAYSWRQIESKKLPAASPANMIEFSIGVGFSF